MSSRAKKDIADFSKADTREAWRVVKLGVTEGSSAQRRLFDRGQDSAQVSFSEKGNLVFEGERGINQ